MARISIVIPHFNRSALISETLASIRRQTMDDWEIVIVDDGSSHEEFQALQRFQSSRIRVFRRHDGLKGPSRCRNLGVNEASSDMIMFVDSDDLIAPWCLESRLKTANDLPNNDFWVFRTMLFKSQFGDISNLWNSPESRDDLVRFLTSDPPWHTSSPLWKRSSLTQIRGFNETIMYGDDSDLHIRALLAGLRHCKVQNQLPDSFVRRSQDCRITNTISAELIDSRLTRLTEGSAALVESDQRLQGIWEGQYLFETEFHLFNTPDCENIIRRILQLWMTTHSGKRFAPIIARTYVRMALALREKSRLAVRVIRRVALLCLPADYFPVASGFHSATLSENEYALLKTRLGNIRRSDSNKKL